MALLGFFLKAWGWRASLRLNHFLLPSSELAEFLISELLPQFLKHLVFEIVHDDRRALLLLHRLDLLEHNLALFIFCRKLGLFVIADLLNIFFQVFLLLL